jgi:ABC-type transport system involved in multi-copper enzyme maturation permease subunit
MRFVWGSYAVLSLAASAWVLSYEERIEAGAVNGLQFSIGLLLASVTSVTSLFEERVRGSLDVLLATPMSTASIVWGKWWAGFRTVVLISLLPTGLGCCLALREESAPALLLLLVLLMLAYGALVVSVGLALATWVQRFGVAVGLSVTVYLLLTLGFVLLLVAGGPGGRAEAEVLCISPLVGVAITTSQIAHFNPHDPIVGPGFWFVAYLLGTLLLLHAIQSSFDRCLGRVEGWDPPADKRSFEVVALPGSATPLAPRDPDAGV